MCKNDFNVDKEPGAILLGPPELIETPDEKFYAGLVQKIHICRECWNDLYAFILFDKNKQV